MRVLILTILILINFRSYGLYAQVNIQHIKSDSKYWSAEGNGTTVEEADHDALSQIIRQISVSVSTTMQEENENRLVNEGVEYSYYAQKGFVKSSSFASLQNVEMIVLEPEPNAKVFRWVAKSEVDRMFEERKNKILDFVKTGKIAEQRLQIDDALRNYYWALMLAKVNRDAVYADFNTGEEVNCLTFLPLKIKSVISRVRANLEECVNSDNRYFAKMRFTYENRDVASIQLRYFDGQSFVGPLVVKDGIGEMDLVSLPADGKMKMRYEYSFRKEAENLDAELRAIFSEISAPPIDNALAEIPVKVNVKKNTMAIDEKRMKETAASVVVAEVPAEPIRTKQRMELSTVSNSGELANVLQQVENAIKQGTPQAAYPHFTPEGYKLFETLLSKTGTVSLVGEKQNYEFIQANAQVLARFCKVKIKFRNGKSFMENLVFRFNEESKKIQSVALALSKKAEEDIFNAASSWTEISRFTILQFMEDYQTAYSLKRLDYLEKIFSDEAIIITGTVLKTASSNQVEGMPIDFGNTDVRFTRQNKQQYLSNLRRHFNEREYIHLTFEDNQTKVINAPRIPRGTAFAIQINQLYNSPIYSDRGYLTLILDASKELPVIHVRLWQPEKSNMLTLDEFMNKFEF